jgi:NAD(P)-dependent dehydrogenase (short-subunit alcohol dehydrogenase family)
VRLCDEASIPLAVNQNMRYDQSMRALKTLLNRGYLGDPVVAQITMHARPHWQSFIREYDRVALLNMSIHHMDIYRFLFGDPERIMVSVRTDPRTDFPHSDGMAFYILEYADGLRAVGIDNTFSWVDHGIEWRVEGTEGVAKGTIGWPDYPAGSPSTIDFLTKRRPDYWFQPRWDAQWFPAGVHRDHGPVDARGRDGNRARDLRSGQPEDDGPDRGGLPLGARGACGVPGGRVGGGSGMSVSPFRLDGRVAIVTGGGGGLGAGICPALAAAGASVVVAGRTKEKLDRVAADVNEAGGQAIAVEVDIADAASVAAMTERVLSELGGIDILVNNAAVYHRKPWTEITEADWDQVIDTNLKGYYLCARAAYPALKESGRGRIINVASITFFGGIPNLLDYVASKGGIVGFTRALAREVGPEGITVNTLSPGAFPTDAEKIHPDLDNYNREILAAQSIKRRGTPEDVGNLVTFLAGDASSFITGQLIQIDGGWMMH